MNFNGECARLAKALQHAEMLPAIVFCMSRAKCVEGAHALKSLTLLVGAERAPKPADEDGEAALAEWEAKEAARKEKIADVKRAREQLRRAHLQRFDAELAGLDAYADMWALLEVGVAHHTSCRG